MKNKWSGWGCSWGFYCKCGLVWFAPVSLYANYAPVQECPHCKARVKGGL